MSRWMPTYRVLDPRGEIEVAGHGISISYPTRDAAQAEADRRNNGPSDGSGR